MGRGDLRAGRAPGGGTPGASCRLSGQASLTWDSQLWEGREAEES